MAVPEASALSHSQSMSTAQEAAARQALVSGQFSVLDHMFPLFEEMLKFTNLPKFIYYILLIFLIFQNFAISFWPGLVSIHKYDTLDGQIVEWLLRITLFTDLKATNESFLIRFLIYTVLFIIFVLSVLVEYIIFNKTRRFPKPSLYVLRIIFELIPIICLCPLSNFVGSLMTYFINTMDMVKLVFLIFTTIYYGIFMFIHYIVSKFFNMTPYLSTSPSACWSGDFYFLFMSLASIFVFVSYIFEFFAEWMNFFLVALKIIFDAYMITYLLGFPFSHIYMNDVMLGFYASDISLDICSLIKLSGVSLPYYAEFIVIFSVMLIAYLIAKIVNSRRIKKIVRNLDDSALEGVETTDMAQAPENTSSYLLSDPIRRQHFINIGIMSLQSTADIYMRVGIANKCSLFLDWSLFKFAGECYQNPKMFVSITHMLSFFPMESRLMGYFFKSACQSDGLSLPQRFLLYQANIIKNLRQSSTSTEITDKIMALKHQSSSIRETVQGFWKVQPSTPALFYEVQKKSNQIRALFNEAIDRWPNSIKLCEDYASFLIEASTDFTVGLRMKHRANLIEQGKNFVVDLSFRSLVRAYPWYLKKGVVDVKGNFIISNGKSGGMSTNSSANSSNISTGTIDGVLDVEIEEALAKISFNYHRLRLAFQHALDERKSKQHSWLIISLIWTFLLFTACMLFLFIFYFFHFDDREDNMNRQYSMNRIRYGLDGAMLTTTIKWFSALGMMPKSFTDFLKQTDIANTDENIHLGASVEDEISRFVTLSRDSMSNFISELVSLAAEGNDIHELMPEMADAIVPFTVCNEDEPVPKAVNDTLKNIFTRMLVEVRNVLLEDPKTSWSTSHRMCEVVSNLEQTSNSFNSLAASIIKDQEAKKDRDEETIKYLMIFIPLGFVLLSEPLILTFLTLSFHELNSMLKMLSSIDDDSKAIAVKPIRHGVSQEQESNSVREVTDERGINKCMLYSVALIPLVIGVAATVTTPYVCKSTNEAFLKYNNWQFYGLVRSNYIVESITYAYFMIALTEPLNPLITKYADLDVAKTLANATSTKLVMYNNYLMQGSDTLESCVGINSELDDINLKGECIETDVEKGIEGFHDNYRCDSLDSDISAFKTLMDRVLVDYPIMRFTKSSVAFDLYHIANTHMLEKSATASKLLTQLAENKISSFRTYLAIITFVFIFIMGASLIVLGALFERLETAFQGSLQVMRRLPPLCVTSNHALMAYIMNRKEEKNHQKMTPSMSVIHLSTDSVIFVSRTESIEFVNASVSNLFGYTPEQLLGQPLQTLMPSDECDEVYQQMSLMRNGQCSLNFEGSTTALTDDNQAIPLHITLIGVPESNGTPARSFVIILRDESQIVEQRAAAEKAKAQSEKLLFQILPRDIVARLNRGETDITLTVKTASIIFIDIVKFSDYSAMLQPGQIMENLSFIFAKFDTLVAKYPLITKIKLIGDVYMAAAGLFSGEDANPADHARQMVQFGLDALGAIEEANAQLDASLQVRIGVNTGGPIIAGVLGTDKPVFDIIGDPINVASRLQSTCIPGTVQISEGTFDLIKEMNFCIETRGEIELKGKGKKKAFIVRPMTMSSFFGAGSDPGE